MKCIPIEHFYKKSNKRVEKIGTVIGMMGSVNMSILNTQSMERSQRNKEKKRREIIFAQSRS